MLCCSISSKLQGLLTDRTYIACAMVLKLLWSADLGRHETIILHLIFSCSSGLGNNAQYIPPADNHAGDSGEWTDCFGAHPAPHSPLLQCMQVG